MRRNLLGTGLIGCLMLAAAPAAAQSGSSSLGGGLLGRLLPNVGGATAGNAAGLLSYCLKNRLLGGEGAKSALSSLMGRSDVTSSSGFAAGERGQLVTDQGSGLSLDMLKGKLKAKACDMVMQRAGSFLQQR